MAAYDYSLIMGKTGTGWKEIIVDGVTRYIVAIDDTKHHANTGTRFFNSQLVNLNSTEKHQVLIVTPANDTRSHMQFSVVSTVSGDLEIYDAATVSSSGTQLSGVNSKRDSTNVAGTQIFHTPTITTSGFLVYTRRQGAFTVNKVPDMVLASGTAYLIDFTSNTASNGVSIVLDWYEHTPLT